MVFGEIAQSLSRTNGLSSLCGDIRSSSCGRIINLEKARITAESNAIISQWFDILKETYEEYSIQPDDFWNYDESGIICGLGGDEYVITLSPRQVVSSKHFNRELITLGECISAAGEVITPLLIIKGKHIQERWVLDTRWHKRKEFESRGGKVHYA
jgi:hypothetical protein